MTIREAILTENPALNDLDKFLVTEREHVEYVMNFPSIVFIQIFREQIRSTILQTHEAASRSNWTYNIAFAFMAAAKAMNFDIRFEAEGKRDAIVETYDLKGQKITLLAAEWEWDSKDVFGPGKEIEKLFKTAKKYKCESLLLTYVETAKYNEFLQKVMKEWREYTQKAPNLSLVLSVILYQIDKSARTFQTIRTVEIDVVGIDVWEDLAVG